MQTKKIERLSNLELYRILVMLLIVAHHYVVNSGLIQEMQSSALTSNSLFLYLYGMWGKTGINCFVLITGYFMCKSNISYGKFFKLLFEIIFYKVTIFIIFVITGIIPFSFIGMVKSFIPLSNIGDGFTTGFILFYLFIPFLNMFINNVNKKMHKRLILLCLFIYVVWYMLPGFNVTYNYISWFIVLYFISSYIRYYQFVRIAPKYWGYITLILVCMSSFSVVLLILMDYNYPYRFVSDSNAIFALLTAIASFMWFKDLKIRQSRLINTIAASSFGVLLIHANSDAMRQWLWKDTLSNTSYLNSSYCILHAIASVLIVYLICICIDYMRIKYIEQPFFKSDLYNKIENKVRGLMDVF